MYTTTTHGGDHRKPWLLHYLLFAVDDTLSSPPPPAHVLSRRRFSSTTSDGIPYSPLLVPLAYYDVMGKSTAIPRMYERNERRTRRFIENGQTPKRFSSFCSSPFFTGAVLRVPIKSVNYAPRYDARRLNTVRVRVHRVVRKTFCPRTTMGDN